MNKVPSVPDTRKRLLAHAASMGVIGVGFLFEFIHSSQGELVQLFPDVKWLPGALKLAGIFWNIALRYKESLHTTDVLGTEDNEQKTKQP